MSRSAGDAAAASGRAVTRGIVSRLRDLPIAWKMAVAPLVMVLIFTPPALFIIRDLTSTAEDQIADTLGRRSDQAATVVLQEEFYLLESVRFAANVGGMPAAVSRSDPVSVDRGATSAIALKDRLNVLVVVDVRGVALAQIERRGGEQTTTVGADWSASPLVADVLSEAVETRENRGGIFSVGETAIFAVSGPIRAGEQVVGAVIAGIALDVVVAEIGENLKAPAGVYGADGRLLSAAGGFDVEQLRDREGDIFEADIAGESASVLARPLEVAGSTAGVVAVSVERAPAFALASEVTRNLEILLAVAILAGLALLVVLTRFLLRQIRAVVVANRSLGRGELDARADVLSADELGQVAEGLNAMAQELQTSYSELETRVVERTKQLEVARDEAEEATRAKAAFLANMSHEIRTPMNAIIGMTSLLLDTSLAGQQREFVETIRTSSDHLLTIINDILDLSKIEAGRLELELHPFAVRAAVEEALDLVSYRASEKHIELAYAIEESAPGALLADLGRLRQVLLNLLSNAVKFTETGEVVVFVDAQRQRGKRHEIHFQVRDTGIGIPKDRMDRLFTAFSQVDASTTRVYGGTGLGLAISRLLVELMGGRIWVESAPGKGSTFHFTILAEATELDEAQLPMEQVDLAGRKVLVLDDNKTNRKIAASYVKKWGMIPTEESDPVAALELLSSKKGKEFALCLFDHDMPVMTGVDVAKECRKRGNKTPIIMLSSLGSTKKEIGFEFEAVLTKPIKPSQLHDAVMKVIVGIQPRKTETKDAPAFDPGMAGRLPLRILVAEDNAVNQKVMSAVLGRLGYSADFASNGKEAVEAVERQPYDLILMDVQMPEMDGLEATRTIVSRWPASRRPRIVALTANATPEDRRMCLQAGMDDYLSKPVTPPKLVEALGRCAPMTDGNGGRQSGRKRTRSSKMNGSTRKPSGARSSRRRS